MIVPARLSESRLGENYCLATYQDLVMLSHFSGVVTINLDLLMLFHTSGPGDVSPVSSTTVQPRPSCSNFFFQSAARSEVRALVGAM